MLAKFPAHTLSNLIDLTLSYGADLDDVVDVTILKGRLQKMFWSFSRLKRLRIKVEDWRDFLSVADVVNNEGLQYLELKGSFPNEPELLENHDVQSICRRLSLIEHLSIELSVQGLEASLNAP